jgi:hypothetical protein
LGVSNSGYVPLLGADIGGVMRAAKARNPRITLAGVDETRAQRRQRERGRGSRDQSIVLNVRRQLGAAGRTVALFGALHCSDQRNWLFGRLRSSRAPFDREEMLNITVLGEHQDGPVEAFTHFLDEIGIDNKGFVIPATSALPPLIYAWFSPLRSTFGGFKTAIVFRSCKGSSSDAERRSGTPAGTRVCADGAQ